MFMNIATRFRGALHASCSLKNASRFVLFF
jgi:hypothetical protein